MKKVFLILFTLVTISSYSQVRDTLKITIQKVEKTRNIDTVYSFSSRVDTIAMQPVIMDTSRIVIDKNQQDLATSKYMIKLMGSVRINGYYDFAGMTSTEGFLPYDITVGEVNIKDLSSVYIGARQSRLGIEGEANTKAGHIKTYVEVDFASSSSSLWRLRHAYAEWNFLKIGYTWTTFMDNASLPTTVDFEGPNSALSIRHGLIRYESKFGEKSIAGISFEVSQSDYFNPGDSIIGNKNKQGNLDFAGRYKYFSPWGHFQLAGIFRRLDYLNQTKINVLYGWGFLLSGVVNFNEKNILYAQYSFGESIANYYVGFSGRQLDAVYNPITGLMSKKLIQGGFGTYTHVFNPSWRASVTGGLSYLKGKEFESGDTFKSSSYFAGSIFFDPIETIRLGFEITSGMRKNLDLQKGSATRISMIANFDF